MISRTFNYIFPCFLLLFSDLLFSQAKNITGTIIDNETKMPIHGVNIFSEELSRGTSSKVDGSFILKDLSKNEISLKISMMGYKEVNRSVNLEKINNDIGKVYLITDTLKFGELIVDAHIEIYEDLIN